MLSPILFLKGMCKTGTTFFNRMSFFIFLKYVIIDEHGKLCLALICGADSRKGYGKRGETL